MKQKIIYYKDGFNTIDIKKINSNLYDTIVVDDDFEILNSLNKNDIIFIPFHLINSIRNKINPNIKLILIIYYSHEFIHPNNRLSLLQNKSPNHIIFFITCHLDNKTEAVDLDSIFSFYSFKEQFSDFKYELPIIRNKKFNLFNRGINLYRLKIFEILRKANKTFDGGYITFGNIFFKLLFHKDEEIWDSAIEFTNQKILLKKQKLPKTLKEYYNLKNKAKLNIDIDYVEEHRNDYQFYGNRNIELDERGWFKNHTHMTGHIINDLSKDSYISFITEGTDDSADDLRFTEKIIRALLCKNIFLIVQCNGFNQSLKKVGIETFEDIFGLKPNWDECDENSKVEIFTDNIIKINELPIEYIETMYNRKDVQDRIEKNYNFIINAFDDDIIYEKLNKKLKEISVTNKKLL